ncbi:hypothetical protein [Mycolicibacterium sp. 120270]|uniref:hypothetical protein n=1 Tax=Mycolicibacterium sp. 120270 TaxID=3090600 RepID=UPI00299F4396|nr:hypothetical protein [Mycolicibacterium sp. 120270]MDX1883050.1 hypothetical protein [Mycolicibacterium sp. 120270]
MTETIGPHRADDPRGLLLFEWLPDDLQRHEDATQAHDFSRGIGGPDVRRAFEFDPFHGRRVWAFYRTATPTERLLLEHLGYELPAELETRVQYITETLRRRTWPALETEGDTAA